MGLIVRSFIFAVLFSAVSYSDAFAAWQGFNEVVSGSWGTDVGQFGIERGDTSTILPSLKAVLPNGKIVISDSVNNRQLVFNPDGTLFKEVKWIQQLDSAGNEIYVIPDFSIGNMEAVTNEGNLLTSSAGKYYLISSDGHLLKTYTSRPPEAGIIREGGRLAGKYKITITYPDKIYTLLLSGPYKKYVRDNKENINAIAGKEVRKFSVCGKELGFVTISENQRKVTRPAGGGFEAETEIIAEYGEPVIAPNGDVYTWKRTPDKYSILKWTWVDDPNVPTGPEPPTNLSLTPSINGLYLTWQASPNDPGCVTKYEIARATTSGGVFSTIDTVEKGVLKYNDTTAEVGTTYYYKVRAMAGSEYSQYTTEVSGKR